MDSPTKKPGVHSEDVAELPVKTATEEDLKGMLEIPGAESNLIENPGEESVMRITVNSIVLPQEKK